MELFFCEVFKNEVIFKNTISKHFLSIYIKKTADFFKDSKFTC